MNIGRMGALAAGLPFAVPGMSIDRQCASGLMAIATAASRSSWMARRSWWPAAWSR
jgi:acetyl-CoA C-acetyltransferase